MVDTVLIALCLEVLTLAVGAVWAVTRIKATTEVLSETMRNLRASIENLDLLVERLDDKVDNHGERLAVLETQNLTKRL